MVRQQSSKPGSQFVRWMASGMVMVSAAITTATVGEIMATTPNGIYVSSAGAAQSVGEKVNEKAGPAVVSIMTTTGWGSGMIVQQNGLVLTNAHVVRGERTVTVVLKDGKTKLKADVIALAQDCVDLALVQIRNQSNLPTLSFASSNSVHPGQPVFAIGSPAGEDLFGSLTQGIVSKLHPEQNLIQSSVPLNPGNSGGPLLNEEGALIGVNTSIRRNSQGISFSIGLNQVQTFLTDYKQGRTLSAAAKTAQKQEIGAIAMNGSKTLGKLTQKDQVACINGSFFDTYQFEGKAGQPVMIRMESKAFAPYLVLLGPNGKEIAIDENSPNDDYAVIAKQLPASGTYRVIANSRKGKQEGAYTVSVTPLILLRSGELAAGNRKFKDGSLYQDYNFQGQANQTIKVATYSPDFAPYLLLVNANGKVIAESRGSAHDRDSAVLRLKLPQTGSYKVVVVTLKPGQVGKYSLMVQ
ncbi:MAG: trypsin-like peptidase domain-containing protein [Kovacikia sp.]